MTDLEAVGIEGIESFMTVPRCMLTLLSAAFGGEDWAQFLTVLEQVGIEAATCFLLYLACMLMAVLNVITGVFVENTMSTVREDRELAINAELEREKADVHDLRHLFFSVLKEIHPHLDCSMDRIILSEPDFDHIVVHDRVRAQFGVMGLDVNHAQALFRLIDLDGSGEIDLEEFVLGCMRMKGQAKSVEVAHLKYESNRMLRKLNRIGRMSKHHMSELHKLCVFITKGASLPGMHQPQVQGCAPGPESALRSASSCFCSQDSDVRATEF